MKNTETLVPIDGIFSHEEAKEILINLFKSKINFHQMKNWSSHERFGMDDETSQKRIPVLKVEMEKLNQILLYAENTRQKLKVQSAIHISFVENV